MNWSNVDEIFKKTPDVADVKVIMSSLFSSFERKLNPDYLKEKYDKQTRYNADDELEEMTDIYLLNNSIRDIIKDLTTSTTSQLLCVSNRFLKKPYSREVSNKIVKLHSLLEDMQEKYLKTNTSSSITLLLFGIFISYYIRHCKSYNSTSMTTPDIHWYYGDYNNILDTIESHQEELYWMDEELTWSGYTNEKVIVIVLNEEDDDNMLKYYLKSLSVFMNLKGVEKYIIVSEDCPSEAYAELIIKNNIHNCEYAE